MAIASLKPTLTLKTRFAGIAGGFKKATTDIGKSTKILLRKTKVKGESIRFNSILFKKREEGIRRNEKESELEASKVGSGIKAAGRPIIDMGKDLLGRIMDAVGSFILGWLVYNLPTIMSMAQNLITRLQRAGQIIGGFFTNVVKIFTGTIKVAGAILTNLVTLDIFDTNKRVQNSFSDLYNTFGDMKSQIEEGIGLVTKPLGELPGEVSVPQTGTSYTTEPGGTSAVVSGYGTREQQALLKTIRFAEGTAGTTGYSMFFGDRPGQAKYGDLTKLTANQVEKLVDRFLQDPQSRFRGGQSAAVGAYQIIDITAKARALGMDMNRKFDQSFQDEMALRLAASRGVTPELLKKEGLSDAVIKKLSPEWASFPGNTYGQPTKSISALRQTYQQTLSSPISEGPVNQLPIVQGRRLRSGDILTKSIGRGVSYIEITDSYNDPDRPTHKGLDIAAPNGTYIALRYDCEVVAAGWYGNYGYLMDVWVPQLGVQLRMAHLSAILIKTGKIPAGTSFARVGSTGRSSGPHIHFEYDTKKGRSNYGGSGDPSAYVNALLLTNTPNRGSFAPVNITTPQPQSQPPNLAVVSSQPSQVPSLPGQRRAPQVAVVDDRPQQVQTPNIPSGNNGVQMIPIAPSKEMVLNNLIKNHILLDLAYT